MLLHIQGRATLRWPILVASRRDLTKMTATWNKGGLISARNSPVAISRKIPNGLLVARSE